MAGRDERPIVYLTSGIFGYLYRFFPIGRRLATLGHRVVVVTTSGEAVEHARIDGFETRHLGRQEAAAASVPTSEWSAPWGAVARRIPGMSLGPRHAARREWEARSAELLDTTELEDVLGDLDPKLVLTEAEEHRNIRVAFASGLDVMLFEDLYSTRPGPDVPLPARSHQIPTGSWSSRLRARSRWERFFAVEAMRRTAERWWVNGHDWHSTLRILGNRAGLSDADVDRRYLQFYDYTTLPRLRTVATELAFPGEPQPPVAVGPVVDTERVVHDVDPDFEERWTRALRRQRDGARIVYVSTGTFLAGIESLTTTVIDAARGVPETEVIVSVGRDRDAWRHIDVGENVAVFGRVPQLRVLAAADVAVSTGGLNTGHEAVWFGVPVLNLPVGGLDTPGNSARLAYHGLGRRLTPAHISVDAVRAELLALLDDPRYRYRATEMGERLRAYDAVARAVAVVDGHLAGG
jgi:UDP:flavonoid glycosyltransferase YjiC (YdhE family)